MKSYKEYFLTTQTARLIRRGDQSEIGWEDERLDRIMQNGLRISFDDYDTIGADYPSHIRVQANNLLSLFKEPDDQKESVQDRSFLQGARGAKEFSIDDKDYIVMASSDIIQLRRAWPNWTAIFQTIPTSTWVQWKNELDQNNPYGEEVWLLQATVPYTYEISGWLNWAELTRAREYLGLLVSKGRQDNPIYLFHQIVADLLTEWVVETSIPIEQMLQMAYVLRYNGDPAKKKPDHFSDGSIKLQPNEIVFVTARKAEELLKDGCFIDMGVPMGEKAKYFSDVDEERQVDELLKYRCGLPFIEPLKIQSEKSTQYDIGDLDTLIITLPEVILPKSKIQVLITGKGGSIKSNPIEIAQTQASFLLYLAKERESGGEDWLCRPEDHKDALKEIDNFLELSVEFGPEIAHKPKDSKKPKTWIWDFGPNRRKHLKSRILERLELRGRIDGSLIIHRPTLNPSRQANYSLTPSIKSIKIKHL